MRLALLAALYALAATVAACNKKTDALIQATPDDPRLVAAADEARRRFDEFRAAFQQRQPDTAYAVKVAYTVRTGGAEVLWIQVHAIDGDTITGVIDNEPVHDIGHKYGDTVTVSVDEIQDWLIAKGPGNMTGGFSIPVLEQIRKERGN